MLSRCKTVELAVASLVGVCGWPVLLVIGYAWCAELQMTDALWWVVGVVLATATYLQWELTKRLVRYLDPRS